MQTTSKSSECLYLTEKVCCECGKTIVKICFDEYVYKRRSKYYCSWTCFRKEFHRNAALKEATAKSSKNSNKEKKKRRSSNKKTFK